MSFDQFHLGSPQLELSWLFLGQERHTDDTNCPIQVVMGVQVGKGGIINAILAGRVSMIRKDGHCLRISRVLNTPVIAILLLCTPGRS